MAKVRHSSNQIVRMAESLQEVANEVGGKGTTTKVGYLMMSYSISWEAEQDFAKDLRAQIGAGVDAPAIESMVDVEASGGIGSGSELEQDSTVRVTIRGSGSNHLRPQDSQVSVTDLQERARGLI